VKIGRTWAAAAVSGVLAFSTVAFARPASADSFRNDEWHLRSLNVAEAQRLTTGKGITVAVLDTGVYPHPDLRNNLLKGRSMLAGASGDGRVDPNGHGTGMASLIAAHGRGPNGVLGIAPAAKILPVTVLDGQSKDTIYSISDGFEYAVDNGAQIINFSGSTSPDKKLIAAVAAAGKKDVLIVAAAGNTDKDVLSGYPASIPGVLAVGASTRANKPASFTFANANVQICAPGIDMSIAKPKNRYASGWGSSDATAVVSGAAALVRARFPQLSVQDVIHRLTATATDIGAPGKDNKCGFGILNVVKALTADVPPLEGTSPPSPSANQPSTPPLPTPAPTTTPAVAAPNPEPTGANIPAITGGIVGVLLVGGLISFLVVRRRRSPPG